MKNISFDNPYLLLIAIPVVLAIIIPYIIAASKDNKTLGWKISLGIHFAIGALVCLALAGVRSVSVLTKTTVYVVADVSYSSERNLDEIDEYIADIKKALPENSSLGVVCFGKNYVVLTPAGRTLKSVSEAKVDDSETDIAAALNYTGSLFKGDTLKRIVLITDGNDTVNQSAAAIAASVERLGDAGIKLDTIFLDNTLKEGETEVQLSKADYTESLYLGRENEARFLVQSSSQTNVILKLYSRPRAESASDETEYEEIGVTTFTAETGFNTVTMQLPGDESGVFEYKAVLEGENDFSPNNNVVYFTQSVEGKINVLQVTDDRDDVTFLADKYGETAEIESYIVSQDKNVPFTVEALAKYDEIVISNVDVRDINARNGVNNGNAFVDSLDIVISQYGKSLITFGDLYLQNDKDDPIFTKFAELLPVVYGNANAAGRLYTIAIDVSASMNFGNKLATAKQAAISLLSILEDDDYVCLIDFAGGIRAPIVEKLKYCKDDLIKRIEGLTISSGGTDIGAALNRALMEISEQSKAQNNVMLISDGKSFGNSYDAMEQIGLLREKGAVLSTIEIYVPSTDPDGSGLQNMRQFAEAGGGKFHQISREEDVNNLVFGTIANEVTEAIVRSESNVNIVNYKSGIVNGFTSFPNVSAFIQSYEKSDAVVPLTISYDKAISGSVPFYAYRMHGNGKVSSFTSSFTNGWTALWNDSAKTVLFENILVENTPERKVDYPYNLKVEYDDYEVYVEVTPSLVDPKATASVTIVNPNGTKSTRELIFDSQKYFYTFSTKKTGAYKISVTYSYGDESYIAEYYFNLSYLPEYNAYTSFDSAKIYDFMRGNGTINIGEIPNLKNDKSEISTRKVSYDIPLLVAAVVLFLIDIIVRKLKFADKRYKKATKEREEAKQKEAKKNKKEKKAEGGERV